VTVKQNATGWKQACQVTIEEVLVGIALALCRRSAKP